MSGEQVKTTTHKLSHKTYSLLCAISAWKVVHYEILETQKCGVNSERFEGFLRNLIVLLPPECIILMDNCKIHKVPRITSLMDLLDVEYRFLPPYSPDYMPIELAFAFIKLKFKSCQELSDIEGIKSCIDLITEGHLKSWIFHCAKNWISSKQ